ncbi:MAG: heterodisulfide reductase subunit B [bacterium]|nr:heterodisulfide reductase subunit B [bacterium]
MTDTHNSTPIAIYPGCSLEASAGDFKKSLERVLNTLEVSFEILEDWNCCGATSAHVMDSRLHLSLNLRNLAVAENKGYTDVLVPCAACYHRLAGTAFTFRENPQLLKQMNEEFFLNYRGTVKIRNVLDVLANDVGVEAIREHVKTRLSGYNVVCYYGCLNTRVPRMECFDQVEYPVTMDRILSVLGARVLDWSYKTECCGAGHFFTNEAIQHKLTGKILQDALGCGANAIAVSCPMCLSNLEIKQKQIRKQANIKEPVPVFFVTDLMAMAFGKDERII